MMKTERPATENQSSRHRDIVCALIGQQTPVCFSAHGPSMNPLIRDGDVVRVCPTPLDTIRPGHILLCRQFGRLTLHRMIRRDRRRDCFLMAADAALDGLDAVDAADILGIAESVRRNGTEQSLDARRARWNGLALHYARPFRKMASRSFHCLYCCLHKSTAKQPRGE